jgi:hypothetical protein
MDLTDNIKINEKECWIWLGALTKPGYGTVQKDNIQWLAHRLSFTLFKGEIPRNKIVRHKCDNRQCINPEHLELGSYKDNRQDTLQRNDSLKKGTAAIIKPKNITKENIIEWLADVSIITDAGCWNYPINDTTRYPRIAINGIRYTISRLLCCINYNLENEDKFVARHLCHNKICVNPEHIQPGTNKQNTLDSRHYHKGVKLTADQVRMIKADLLTKNLSIKGSKKEFDQFWADIFSCSTSMIESIRLGYNWTDIIIV